MQITIQGKQMDVGESLKIHASEKLEDLNTKYFNHATDAIITFSPEGHGHGLVKAHISMRIGHEIMVMAEAQENDPYLSFDVASARIAKQLRRYKERLRDHKEKNHGVRLEVPYYVIADDEKSDDGVPQGEDPVTIAEMVTNIETLCVSDAVMRLDLTNQTALLFRNPKHGELNLVYRRPDGNVGWIDPADALQRSQAAE